ncbi:unnamed protein product [Caenorhabditis auriculariae]|uniref:Uncharacterized protein n=1 Tax=Caenorhabditis auriculariae TaxID=2777116 RepID=A0A8S1HEX7_9PELO|nr:unnamed protein product [Caenorhabditis auriculariae]
MADFHIRRQSPACLDQENDAWEPTCWFYSLIDFVSAERRLSPFSMFTMLSSQETVRSASEKVGVAEVVLARRSFSNSYRIDVLS